MTTFTLPDHISYSAYSSYKNCPRSYYLGRGKKAEAVPAWYFVIGSTVHSWIEGHLMSWYGHEEGSIEEIFTREVLKRREVEPDTGKWLYGGSDSSPVRDEAALKLAQDCVERALEWLEGFEVEYVEPEFTGSLPGCPVPIKAFPDLTGEHKKHGRMIVDWKTGKTRGDRFQLETYNVLSGNKFPKGQFVMLNPEAGASRPLELVETPESVGQKYGEVWSMIRKGVFPVFPSRRCEWCDMKPNCKIQSGVNKRTAYYDTPDKDGVLPF